MRRQEKYPDTDTFHFYNANCKNKYVGDCTVRAICTALEQSWENTVREMNEMGIKYGNVFNDIANINRYLKSKGWIKHSQPRHSDNTKYTGVEFCKKIRLVDEPDKVVAPTVVANIGGHHIVAIVNGKINDTWNSTGGCIGNYWTKE